LAAMAANSTQMQSDHCWTDAVDHIDNGPRVGVEQGAVRLRSGIR